MSARAFPQWKAQGKAWGGFAFPGACEAANVANWSKTGLTRRDEVTQFMLGYALDQLPILMSDHVWSPPLGAGSNGCHGGSRSWIAFRSSMASSHLSEPVSNAADVPDLRKFIVSHCQVASMSSAHRRDAPVTPYRVVADGEIESASGAGSETRPGEPRQFFEHGKRNRGQGIVVFGVDETREQKGNDD